MKPTIFLALAAMFFLLKGDLFAQLDFGPAVFSTLEIVAGGGEGYRELVGGEILYRNDNEVPGSSWMVGLKTSRRISNRFWMGLGVNPTNIGYRTQTDGGGGVNICSTSVFGGVSIPDLGDVFSRGPDVGLIITPSSGNSCFRVSNEEGQDRQTLFNSQQMEIPLTVRYELDQLRFRPFIEAGLTGSYTVRNSVREIRGGEVVKAARQQLEERKRFGLGMVLSVGAAYGLNENYSVFAQPVYRYSFFPTGLTTGDEMTEHSRSLMIQVGIRKDVY
ncbi:MAG: hypothetical protein ACI81P_001273 [Neolewinella sp.]|jgi:hypothetical protein